MTCVVVVEDERDLLSLVSDVLEMDGFHVIPLDHPHKMETLERPRCECVLLFDLMLPEIDGIVLAQFARTHGYERSPLIAMSASPEMLERARRSGLFNDTLPKPFHIDQVSAVVNRYAS